MAGELNKTNAYRPAHLTTSQPADNTDLDTFVTSGVYYVGGWQVLPNAPENWTQQGALFVIGNNSNRIVQIAFSVYARKLALRFSNGSFGSWYFLN